jgi:glycosyltransferase involved in cell wall biosynthesis
VRAPPSSLALLDSGPGAVLNFRADLIADLTARGVKVWAIVPDLTPEAAAKIRALGAVPIASTLRRTGLNPLADLRAVAQMVYLLRRLRPAATLGCTIKPATYGTLAAWAAGVPRRFALIEGLGFAFMKDPGAQNLKRRAIKQIAKALYRLGLPLARRVFVTNPDDLRDLTKRGLLRAGQAAPIPGIGVNLHRFAPAPPVPDPVTFILVARMLREKGVHDFVEAARIVKARHPGARFVLVGDVDANPGSITRAELQAWSQASLVDWRGAVEDVRPHLEATSVFVLPSYYREGLPRSTMEALAMARPVITTDVPGCRETVVDGENGFLVPVRDPRVLAATMGRFITNTDLITTMGARSRRIAEQKFDVRKINTQILSVLSA